MADRAPTRLSRLADHTAGGVSSIFRLLQGHSMHSTHFVGLVTLIITGTIFLLLTGITVTTAFLGFVFVTPLLIISSPLWAPIVALLFVVIAGLVSICGAVAATVGSVAWLYRYLRGMQPPGSERVDLARSRIYDTANHVKDYAREYGGYLKDAAPGA